MTIDKQFRICLIIIFSLAGLMNLQVSHAQTNASSGDNEPGGPDEPIRVLTGGIDMDVHDGRLRPAIGVENIQVMRANRMQASKADNYGWTYSHAPNLAYWNDKFFLHYLSNPFGEHIAPGHTLVTTSEDGRDWEMPEPVFPMYQIRPGFISTHETGMTMMHQRMGFYVAPNGKLLVLGFYGHAPSPYGEEGIGRVVREAYEDGTYGPIYFIRYNSLSDYDESNTDYPFFRESEDQRFIEACEALLSDKLKTMQWWEEDRSTDGFYTVTGRQAPSVYHRKDGTAVVNWKASWAALSSDAGESWSDPVQIPGIITDGAKTWGQRMADDRYALVYNPAPHGSHRWPLALVTSADGVVFDNMLLINGEVPPRRFMGRAKDFGLQYVRGISEGNGTPPGSDMWITYSVNKEDIWISRVPVPVRERVDGRVEDLFDELRAGGRIPDWNIYRTQWADAEIVDFPDSQNKSLVLSDRDPYDYAKAVRVFEESESVNISFRVYAEQTDTGRLEIDVLDHAGYRPVRIVFNDEGYVQVSNGERMLNDFEYKANSWHQVNLVIQTEDGKYDLRINDQLIVEQAMFAESVSSVERLSFRTGQYRTEPNRETDRYEGGDLPDPDYPSPLSVYFIDEVIIQ